MTLQDMIDYEKELSYDKGKEDGYELGEASGISKGISQAKNSLIISAFKNDIPEEQIVNMLVDAYSMTREDAIELIENVKETNN